MHRPAWRSEAHRRRHFESHRRELHVRSVEEYETSAHETMRIGAYFEFADDDAGDLRVGYYDRWTERLTVLSDDELLILTQFRFPERYVVTRRGSTYS